MNSITTSGTIKNLADLKYLTSKKQKPGFLKLTVEIN
jgi:hypothetical protein